MGDITRPRDGGAACSGRFVLRIDPGLHAALREAAAAVGTSLNEYCAVKLAAPVGDLSSFELAAAAVGRAAAVVGSNLAGVVAFGSWARHELHDLSDVDLLVVVDEDLGLTRELYTRWDEAPVVVGGRRVEPHLVRLPTAPLAAVGLWAEAAVDGMVLFARDLRLASSLAAIRRQLVEGRVRRATSHGQPYWVMES